MTEQERSAARMSLPLAQQGMTLDQIIASVSSRLSGATPADILTGAEYAFNAVSYANEANMGGYRQFGDIPFAEEFGYNLRVRLFIDTRVGGEGFAGTMDVIANAGSSIEAIKEYARQWAKEIRNREDTLPGGSGSTGGAVNPEISIVAIFGADDSVSEAKRTVSGV